MNNITAPESKTDAKINRQEKRRAVRKLAGNFLWLSLLEGFNHLMPLITLPYLTRVLGTGTYGMIVFARSLSFYFVSFIGYGFILSSTREIARNRHNPAMLNTAFSSTLYASCLLTLLSFFVLMILMLFVQPFKGDKLLYLFSFGMVLDTLFLPRWFFQGMEKMGYITMLSVSAKSFFIILMFFVIRSPEDYLLVPALTTAGFIISGAAGLFLIRKRFNIRLVPIHPYEIIRNLKVNFSLFLTSFVPTLYNNTSTFLLGIFVRDSSLVTYYSTAAKIIEIPDTLLRILSRTMFPHLCRDSKHHAKFSILLIISGTLMGIAMYVTAPLIIKFLLPGGFDIAIGLVRILSPCPLFLSLSFAYGTNYLVVQGRDKLYMAITLTVSLTGLGISFLLIPVFQHLGSSIVLLSSRGMLGLTTLISAIIVIRGSKAKHNK